MKRQHVEDSKSLRIEFSARRIACYGLVCPDHKGVGPPSSGEVGGGVQRQSNVKLEAVNSVVRAF